MFMNQLRHHLTIFQLFYTFFTQSFSIIKWCALQMHRPEIFVARTNSSAWPSPSCWCRFRNIFRTESTMNSCWIRHEKLKIWETLGCNWFDWFNLEIQWFSMVFSSILCSWNSAKLWPHQLKSVIFQPLRVRASKSLPIISDSMCRYMIWNDDQSIRQPMTYSLHQSTIFGLISSCIIIYIKLWVMNIHPSHVFGCGFVWK